MCYVDKNKRPTVNDLYQNDAFKRLFFEEDNEINKIAAEKDDVMQSVMVFNHQARR